MSRSIFNMEELRKFWKAFNKRMLIPIFVGVAILLFSTLIMPGKLPIHESEFSIDQYGGAINASAKWEYEIQHEKRYIFSNFFDSELSWAFFDMDVQNIENNFNLTDCKGISFYITGNGENIPLEFNLFTHELNKKHEIYQYSISFSVNTAWQKKEIMFTDLTIAPWTERAYPNAPKKPDLEKVYAIGFAAKTSDYRDEVIHIDEIELIYKNGSKEVITDFTSRNTSIKGIDGIWYTGTGHH